MCCSAAKASNRAGCVPYCAPARPPRLVRLRSTETKPFAAFHVVDDSDAARPDPDAARSPAPGYVLDGDGELRGRARRSTSAAPAARGLGNDALTARLSLPSVHPRSRGAAVPDRRPCALPRRRGIEFPIA
jgi:hypothetical protein